MVTISSINACSNTDCLKCNKCNNCSLLHDNSVTACPCGGTDLTYIDTDTETIIICNDCGHIDALVFTEAV